MRRAPCESSGRVSGRRGSRSQTDVGGLPGAAPRFPETCRFRARWRVRLQFTLGELSALFEPPVGLGTSGEVFLSDSAGTILTPTRFRGATVPAAMAVGHSCVSGPFERNDIDYRGMGVIQGVVSVSAFAQPLCVDAHVSREQALAPAAS